MKREFRAGDKVLMRGGRGIFEVLSKRFGLNFYEVGKKHSIQGQEYITDIHDGLYDYQLILITDATMKTIQDLQNELNLTSEESK